MRLVSVVVPLWLTATASVSLMSRRSPKPDSSVAVTGVDVERVRRRARRARRPSPGRRRRPCPGRSRGCADRPAAQPVGDVRRQRPRTDDGTQPPVALDDLAAQRLGEAVRRLGDLLEQEVRGVAAVDVARGDLGRRDVVLGDRQLGAVVAAPVDALERAGALGVEARRSGRRARRRGARSGRSPRPPRTARWRRGSGRRRCRRTRPARCRSARGRAGPARRRRRRRWPPSPRTRRPCAGTPRRCRRRRPRVAGDERRDDLGVGGDRAGKRSPCSA